MAGNHDFAMQKHVDECARIFSDAGITWLRDHAVEVNGITVYGSPWTPRFENWAYMQDDSALEKVWEWIPGGLDILVTHGPPYGILDKTCPRFGSKHVGSRTLLDRVLTVRPKYHVFGHIHEGYGEYIRNGIKFINCSIMNEVYDPVNEPIVLEV